MAKSLYCTLVALVISSNGALAFVNAPSKSLRAESCPDLVLRAQNDGDALTSRRELFRDAAATAFGLGAAFVPMHDAMASGGATAGGAYLLSAKQRYNERVTGGITAFVALGSDIEAGNLKSAKAFFETEDKGGWQDTATAGYLLANAFRTSSTTPPDKLPSVKKWKAFVAEVEGLKKALKKKSASGAQTSYKGAIDLLGDYLTAVELADIL
mmetsp:Transcript_48532/g.146397  ORF Transcript_48532/g.146397 Transcript_48532/m.146397 type:complete len:212 (-) Transcript_48532:202-837(-)|eukprot:CAMPEP_0113551462 /NCGR_PEP_ID=MMETSP0015_2-20120614/14538_1 /TAXON_ID=2838 /ORGANISM="Odontella" /LENGTH=211 /DNA_ID=CAMNT_0000452357 /DNA_START=156 /DNA_END=791 /DNA_ORIENTATION=+ /assembly_acc=CAM_ASM_000160